MRSVTLFEGEIARTLALCDSGRSLPVKCLFPKEKTEGSIPFARSCETVAYERVIFGPFSSVVERRYRKP